MIRRKKMNEFEKILERVLSKAPKSEFKCAQCRDEGLVFTRNRDGVERLWACACEAGNRHREPAFAPSDKEKKAPIQIATYGKADRSVPQTTLKLTGRDRATGEKE
jgi:hypothetical protein